MTLRRALPSDARKLYTLEQELFTAENFPLSRRSFYYHIRHSLLYVAEAEDGALAGYALALIRRRDAKLYSLGVARPYRGRGIAEALTQRILGELGSLGFTRSVLEVRCDNTRAIALYLGLGFNIVKRLDSFYRDGCDAYLMEVRHA